MTLKDKVIIMINLLLFIIMVSVAVVTAYFVEEPFGDESKYSIVSREEGSSKTQCLHRCKLNKECVDIVFDQLSKEKCFLLKHRYIKEEGDEIGNLKQTGKQISEFKFPG